eukprot:maker-scaffold_7-snap-gene-15.39-mRNA-1 protein AED:0.23 eAED:0.25 QI:0/0/0/1/0/0/2/0/269
MKFNSQKPQPKTWISDVFSSEKSPEKYRMVANMKPLNKVTIKTPLTMPNLEQQVFVPMSSSYYGAFDVLSSFDYMSVHEDSMQYFTIITPIGAYEMVGSPMGWINTPMLFQERMQTEILGSKFMKEKEVIYSLTFENYLRNLAELLDRFVMLNLRLNIDKYFPSQKEVEWYGRSIIHQGWKFSSKSFDKIMYVKKPYYRHQLAQALHLENWLSSAVEHLTEYRDYFAKLVEFKKPKAKLKKENEPVEWTEEAILKWNQFLDILNEASKK